MKSVRTFFSILIIVGIILMIGRILTGILLYFDMSFTKFFTDYSLISFVILIVGVLGELTVRNKV
ncbi:hypothetical protein CFK37_07905 [Virgibacillus phasianinus]|uniref:Uncharacterized protein n=1 Tax=Virgibacillus phasianinus TaxID=2017483 RepID=A0A220U2M2_9BACI|nr:hypothetical protein [Virgibacillus phasianinus]ASK62091.1 hypothetical protein CFK37_07905 [Virgibacillus phasianinus]